jgi:protein O-mannosyl-transferase
MADFKAPMRSPATQPAPKSAGAADGMTLRRQWSPWVLAVLLALLTTVLYWPATRWGFVNYDDPDFLTDNLHVQHGLNWEEVKWAFGNTAQAVYWAPAMWLSHMLAFQFFGPNPWGHHLVNVALHSANTVLVFLVFRQLTGATWRSLILAALFGWHPLRVESVAWVTERKDVLSGFFFMLTLWAYARYGQESRVSSQSSVVSSRRAAEHGLRTTDSPLRFTFHVSVAYLLSLLFFMLGLMSKPMLVTLPFVLLLLDYWPLDRIKKAEAGVSHPFIILEKIPFFALAAAASVVTFAVQHLGGALLEGGALPLGARVANALISYGRYLGMMFWPTNLAVFYPHAGVGSVPDAAIAGVLILCVSVLVFLLRQRHGFLLMGWLWYCGTLVPVIGLVQSGEQAMADRFTYLPSLGVMIMLIWGAWELVKGWRHGSTILSVAPAVALALCVAATRHQLTFWRNSETLFRHALRVTKDNYLAHLNLGSALDEKGTSAEAIHEYQEALLLKPENATAHYDLGVALVRVGETGKGISEYREAIRLKPDHAQAHYSLGNALIKDGQLDDAITEFQRAVSLNPDLVEAHNNLGFALARKKQFDEAVREFQEVLRLKPDHVNARRNLEAVLAAKARLGPQPDASRH